MPTCKGRGAETDKVDPGVECPVLLCIFACLAMTQVLERSNPNISLDQLM